MGSQIVACNQPTRRGLAPPRYAERRIGSGLSTHLQNLSIVGRRTSSIPRSGMAVLIGRVVDTLESLGIDKTWDDDEKQKGHFDGQELLFFRVPPFEQQSTICRTPLPALLL